MKKKLFAILLSLTMVVTMMPFMAFADGQLPEERPKSGISTGDSTNVMPYAILGGVALLALLGLIVAKKRMTN